MKIIQVSYDCSMITMILDDNDDVFNVLRESDDSFSKKGDDIYYDWEPDYKELCIVEDVTNQRGIIHEEHH
jgi:hypothetical protein